MLQPQAHDDTIKKEQIDHLILNHQVMLQPQAHDQGSGNPIICRFRPILNSWDRIIFQKKLFYRSENYEFWPIINVFSNTES